MLFCGEWNISRFPVLPKFECQALFFFFFLNGLKSGSQPPWKSYKALQLQATPTPQTSSALCPQQVWAALVPEVTWESCREEPAPHRKNCTGERDLDLSQVKPVVSGIV